jgi:hypothetical protein
VTGEALAPDPQARQETAADSPLRGAALRESPRFRSRCHSGLSRRTRRTSPSFAHQHPSQVDNSVRFEFEAGVILLPNCRPQAFRKLKPLLLKVSMRTDGGQPNATVGARRVEVDPKTGNSHSASPLARRRLPQALPLPTAQTAGHQPIEGESHAADYVGAGTGLSVSLSFGHRRYVATKAIAQPTTVSRSRRSAQLPTAPVGAPVHRPPIIAWSDVRWILFVVAGIGFVYAVIAVIGLSGDARGSRGDGRLRRRVRGRSRADRTGATVLLSAAPPACRARIPNSQAERRRSKKDRYR